MDFLKTLLFICTIFLLVIVGCALYFVGKKIYDGVVVVICLLQQLYEWFVTVMRLFQQLWDWVKNGFLVACLYLIMVFLCLYFLWGMAVTIYNLFTS